MMTKPFIRKSGGSEGWWSVYFHLVVGSRPPGSFAHGWVKVGDVWISEIQTRFPLDYDAAVRAARRLYENYGPAVERPSASDTFKPEFWDSL